MYVVYIRAMLAAYHLRYGCVVK